MASGREAHEYKRLYDYLTSQSSEGDMVVEIEIPDTIGKKLMAQGSKIKRLALEALAVAGYQDGVLTSREVQDMLQLSSRWETDAFLKHAKAWMDYSVADARLDADTIQGLLSA